MTDLELADEITEEVIEAALHAGQGLLLDTRRHWTTEDKAIVRGMLTEGFKVLAALRRGPEQDDKEIGEFQQRVYELCEKFYPEVDGAGSDTGDWRDFTFAEIRQTLNHLAERLPSGKSCPLCGRTNPHSHTSGPLGIS